MQEFIHHKVQIYDGFLKDFNKIQVLFSEKSYEFELRFEEFSNQILDYFKASGNTTVEAEILKTINMLSIVKKGFNPISMEKIQTSRRDFYWTFAFSALESLFILLMRLDTTEKAKLEEGEEIISNLIISLVQNGFLPNTKIKELDSIPNIELYWMEIINQNESLSSINKKLRMKLLPEDIFLLFEKNLAKINF